MDVMLIMNIGGGANGTGCMLLFAPGAKEMDSFRHAITSGSDGHTAARTTFPAPYTQSISH